MSQEWGFGEDVGIEEGMGGKEGRRVVRMLTDCRMSQQCE